MKKIMYIGIILIMGIVVFSRFYAKNWVSTNGTINNITVLDDGTYGYELNYEIEVKDKGKDTINQFYLGQKQKPIENQVIKMKYLVEEPVVYELLEPIKFSN